MQPGRLLDKTTNEVFLAIKRPFQQKNNFIINSKKLHNHTDYTPISRSAIIQKNGIKSGKMNITLVPQCLFHPTPIHVSFPFP